MTADYAARSARYYGSHLGNFGAVVDPSNVLRSHPSPRRLVFLDCSL